MGNKIFFCSSVSGCPSNSYLGSTIVKSLKNVGYEIVPSSKDADYIIINTCGAVNSTEKRSLELVDFFQKKYGDYKTLIVSGCLTKISEKLKDRKGLIFAKGLPELREIFPKISEYTFVNKMVKGLFEMEEFDVTDYYLISIGEGCLGNCSYCSVKFARGDIKSKPFEEVVSEFNEGYKKGFRRFYLIGDDCACYGRDIGLELADLCDVFFEKDDVKVAFNYLEPLWLMKGYSRLKKYFYDDRVTYATIPAQSGNDRVLKLMNRRYKFSDIRMVLKDIRERSSTVLSTYFIFGFPTETYHEFINSVNESSLYDIVTFRLYSERKGTKSVDIFPKVSLNEIRRRAKYLTEFSKTRESFFISLSGEIDGEDRLI